MEVVANCPKEELEAKVNVPALDGTPEELVARHTLPVITAGFLRDAVISVQAMLRAAVKKQLTAEQMQEKATSWAPGVRAPSGAKKKEKLAAQLLKMTKDEVRGFLEEHGILDLDDEEDNE